MGTGVRRTGASGRAEEAPQRAVGDMRKRVGVAWAIVGRPQIILYDEPVIGLDPVTRQPWHG